MNKKAFKLQEFSAHAGTRVESLRLGRKSGRVLVTGGEDKKVNVWAIGKSNAVMSLTGLSSSVAAVAFDSHEEVVAAGSAGGTIKMWDLEEKKVVRTFPGHKTNCVTVDFHPIGQYLASGSLDTQLKIWDIRRKGCIQTYKGHNKGVSIVRFSPDGRWLVSGGEDGVIKIFDIIGGKQLCDFQHHSAPVVSLDFHPNEFLMACGSADGGISFWDLETFEMVSSAVLEPNSSSSSVKSIAFVPNGQALLAAYQNSLCAWRWEPTTVAMDTVGADWSNVMDMAIVSDQVFACTIRDDQVGVWMVSMQKINLGGAAGTSHKPSHSSVLQGGTMDSSTTHLDFQVNSARNAIKANNVLSQYNSIDLPVTDDDNTEQVPSIEDINKQPLVSTPSAGAKPTTTPTSISSPVTPTTPVQPTSTPTTTKTQAKVAKPSRGNEKGPTFGIEDGLIKSAAVRVDTEDADSEFIGQVLDSHDQMISTLTARFKNIKAVKSHWTANGSGTDNKGVLAVLSAVAELDDVAIMVDFLRALPQRDDFFTLDLCTAMLPTLIELLNHTQKDEYLFLGLSITLKLVKLFGNLIKSTRDAPAAKGVDLSKEERLEKCNSCHANLVTIQHLIVPLGRRSGTVGKNAKDLSNLLRIYIPEM